MGVSDDRGQRSKHRLTSCIIHPDTIKTWGAPETHPFRRQDIHEHNTSARHKRWFLTSEVESYPFSYRHLATKQDSLMDRWSVRNWNSKPGELRVSQSIVPQPGRCAMEGIREDGTKNSDWNSHEVQFNTSAKIFYNDASIFSLRAREESNQLETGQRTFKKKSCTLLQGPTH